MNKEQRIQNTECRTHGEKGFSLTEVLLAVGTLAVGMLFIAGVFPVSIYFTTVATERTIAATVADEAFAKIMLFAQDPCCPLYSADFQNPAPSPPFPLPPPPPPPPPFSVSFEDRANAKRAIFMVPMINPLEFSYPSTITDISQKKYWWSAICKRKPGSLNEVQVTVFVSRKAGVATTYRTPSGATNSVSPVAVPVDVTGTTGGYELTITGNKTLINDGYTIVDDTSGQIYRVLERYSDDPATPIDESQIIRIDTSWRPFIIPPQVVTGVVWVVPPPSSPGGGRYPCIAVYQKTMRF
jgi:type II secretory pathway pseudopilin PulG